MDGLREYVIRVVAAALISGVVIRLTEGIGSGEIIRMLCGLFMTLILLQPIIGRRELQWEFMLPQIRRQAEENVLEGVAAAEKIRQEFIMRQAETYISNRAAEMDTEIQAEIMLGEDNLPESVVLTGAVSPLNKSRLTQIIASELGIPRERQEWIG
ncbi:MAG: hypothetical protein MR913_07565 [Clostridiales bacterium]|nr:hypothetical protein [Clostridiales bacterium]